MALAVFGLWLLIWWVCGAAGSAREGAVRVARCRAVCVSEFCESPAYHYAVTLEPVSSECWDTCFRQFQGGAYTCQDPDQFCQTEGCRLACRMYNTKLHHRHDHLQFPRPPVVTVLSSDWLKIMWAEPSGTGAQSRALVYLLLWQAADSNSWTPLDITIETEGEFYREKGQPMPAGFKVLAVDSEGVVAETVVRHSRFIHVAFPGADNDVSSTPRDMSVNRDAPSTDLPYQPINTDSASSMQLLPFETAFWNAVNQSFTQYSPSAKDSPTTDNQQPSSTYDLRLLIIPVAVAAVGVVLLFALVAVMTCQLQRVMTRVRAARHERMVRREEEKRRIQNDEVNLEKYLADPKNQFMLSLDSASPLLATSLLSSETSEDPMLFIPRNA